MKSIWSGNIFTLLVAGCCGIGTALAAAPVEILQGAWAMYNTDCAAIFERVGGEIRFRNPDSSLNTGVIISGNKVVASTATCMIAKVREIEDHFSVLMNCSSAVMIDDVTMAFRIVDETHFVRFDPVFPDFSLEFTKCPL